MADASNKRPKPAVLMVLDGFGVAPDGPGNAVTRAKMPVFRSLIRDYPTMTLRASGEEVGLSWGEMGNSEVGHLAIGAGRVYYQTFPRINRDIVSGDFFENEAFRKAIGHAKKNGSAIHLIGLVSAGRVHSMDEHCFALLELCKKQKAEKVFVHAILDGRDTLYNAGIDFVGKLLATMKKLKVGKLASMSGRYYSMDRDNRWDRVQKAYDAMAAGVGETASDPIMAIRESYAREVYDEQFVPTVMTDADKPVATVKDGDAVIFFNFRPDRMRELVKAFVIPDFTRFPRATIKDLLPVTMVEYQSGLPVEVAYPPVAVSKTLAETVSDAGLTQLHIAETEKYAHVTFFVNGTREEPFKGERRILVPSPRVASYDEAPAMSGADLTDRVIEAIGKGEDDLIIMNYANPDMVGHTGNLPATMKAMEAVDGFLGKVVDAVLEKDGVLFLTADHGNGEEVLNVRTGEIDKEHATNPVPFVIVGNRFKGVPSPAGEVPDGDLSLMQPVGMLADVAPTVLSVLGIPQPPEMTGTALL
ncbi:2,3-bisphosphoglycerate-independent phosphoglycerate mutase [Patescibacteria group bacterium]|nr:MAG: 2,3-bisphosphoglycerate-independent phosphoglycerate mutase [Patescibacteria group bacterium]